MLLIISTHSFLYTTLLIYLLHIHLHFLQSVQWWFCTYHLPHVQIMTLRCHTSPPPPSLPSNTSRSRRSIHHENLHYDLRMTPDNYNDRWDGNSESDNRPLWRPSWEEFKNRPSDGSFTSTLGKWVVVTQLSPPLLQPLHPENQKVYIVLEEEDEREPALQASEKVSHSVFKSLNSPDNVYIYCRKDSNDASEQLVAWKAGNL